MRYETQKVIIDRAKKRIPFELIGQIGIKKFRCGGNSLNRSTPNDIDLFPVDEEFDQKTILDNPNVELITRTKNALTVRYQDTIVQFCNYKYPMLIDLVESFDFSHIKVGVEYESEVMDETEFLYYSLSDIYISDDWKEAKEQESTCFVGSNYPLSSLLRSYKYMKRGDYSGKSYLWDCFSIIVAIYKRGFADYNDFKDQLDAVDLGLIPEDINDLDRNVLSELFEMLRRDGNKSDFGIDD